MRRTSYRTQAAQAQATLFWTCVILSLTVGLILGYLIPEAGPGL